MKIPPTVIVTALPESEWDGAHKNMSHLNMLSHYIDRYASALAFLDYSNAVLQSQMVSIRSVAPGFDSITMTREFMSDPRRGWPFIAMRDAVITVFDFGNTLYAINFKECPALRDLVTHPLLKDARKLFEEHFPRWEIARHAATHGGEMAANSNSHSIVDGYQSDNISVVQGASVTFSGVIDGDRLVSTFNNKNNKSGPRVGSSGLSADELAKLNTICDLVFQAFEGAASATHEMILKSASDARRPPSN